MPTSNDVINQQDIPRLTCKTCQNNFIDKINSCTIGNMSIQSILCVNTFSQTDQDPDDKHEYVNTETGNIIESKKSHSYDIDKQCSKQLLNATNVTTKSLPITGFKKKQQQFLKLSRSILFNYSTIVLAVDMINMLNCGLNFCILPIKIDITKMLVTDLNDPWYGHNFGITKRLQIQNKIYSK